MAVDGEQLLRQLRDRLRELAETPLLLKMLCDVFDPETGQIPQSKGELFRLFDRQYEEFKGLPAVSADFRRFKSEVLQHLAFVMIQGDDAKPTEFELTIERSAAERTIERLLVNRVSDPAGKAKEWLENLLEHHLLQVAADQRQVEFHHQLFQEYYAAECLLERVERMDDETLACDYLNYLKWTEPLALMVALVTDEGLAVRMVERSLSLDLGLGARLAGEVKPKFQANTVSQVAAMNMPTCLRIKLLGKTESEAAIPELLKALEDSNSAVRGSVAAALGKLGSEAAMTGLLQAIEHSNSAVRGSVAAALGKLGSEAAIPGLLQAIEHSNSAVRGRAAAALGNFKDDRAAYILPSLLTLLLTKSSLDAFRAIQGIQANCKFYNYQIHQKAFQRSQNHRTSPAPSPTQTTINTEVVQIIENNHGTVISSHLPPQEPPC